ncbi:YhgE/Pip domain-containing protein [Streptacidiphilus jiangxiensis]|uniref:Putative membrane protein n=1 Tax=Streptacidiphilus jiangxiensis TaxID=235985 RepID=A0A1H7PXW9_STRJI|nr:YhgE/Pip domain-containing protein [Streptacidiphilus jiangxiensis]SEL40264.1 putative membrane protein [Streptacidiphilus jiangxiensis]
MSKLSRPRPLRALSLGSLELRRFRRGSLPRAAVVAVALLPLLYGALYIWSFWDPYGHFDRLPVAIVDQDKGAEVNGKPLDAGRDLTTELLDRHTFDWHEVSAARADEGLRKGDYYMTLTIPADFTARIASGGGDHPVDGLLEARSNDSNSYLSGIIAKTAFSEIRAASSSSAVRGYLDQIYVSFGDLHDQTLQAAGGAGQLAQGAHSAQDGAQQLGDGLKQARTGSGRLADGLDRLHTGAAQAAAGTAQLDAMVHGVTDRLTPTLRSRAGDIQQAAQAVATAAGAVQEIATALPADSAKALADAKAAEAQLQQVHDQQCPATRSGTAECTALQTAVEAAQRTVAVAASVDQAVAADQAQLTRLAADAGTVRGYAQQLAADAPHLADQVDAQVAKIDQLNAGVAQLSSGSAQLATGARSLDDGLGTLASGADRLNSGLYKLAGGSDQLAGSLHDGAARIPDLSAQDRADRTGVMSDPVQLALGTLNKAANYGTGLSSYFIPLALWVGMMVAYMLLRPLNARLLAAGIPSWRAALAGWLPAVAIGVAQVGALLAVLHFALGLQLARPAAAIAFLLLTSASFAALLQCVNAVFGTRGRVIGLAVLMLQLTSAGGTYPVQTSPGFFGAIHPYLPMTWVVDGLRRLISGGDLTVVWQGVGVLTAFLVASLAGTVLAARRRQMWTVASLHPELVL